MGVISEQKKGMQVSEEMLVSVVVPTYNRKELLKRCLRSLFKQSYPTKSYEIIVVDDGSSDGTHKFLKEKEKEIQNLRAFRQKNKGCAAARNLGVKNARGEVILFTDDDCVVPRNWINQHLKHYGEKNVAGVGGTLWPKEMNWIEEFKIAEYLDEFTQLMEVTDPKMGKGLATCNCSYRKKVFERIGPFDENFLTGSDPEFSKRVLSNGYPLIKDPSIKVYHLRIDSFGSILKTRFKRSQGILLERRKHGRFQDKNHEYVKTFINLWKNFRYVRGNIMEEKINLNVKIKFVILTFSLLIAGKLGNLYYRLKEKD
ncbi:Undecaprenyl-phosphate 4-deoxy-4-formamido-L-arabinose transferase [subsurface metagenome]